MDDDLKLNLLRLVFLIWCALCLSTIYFWNQMKNDKLTKESGGLYYFGIFAIAVTWVPLALIVVGGFIKLPALLAFQ